MQIETSYPRSSLDDPGFVLQWARHTAVMIDVTLAELARACRETLQAGSGDLCRVGQLSDQLKALVCQRTELRKAWIRIGQDPRQFDEEVGG